MRNALVPALCALTCQEAGHFKKFKDLTGFTPETNLIKEDIFSFRISRPTLWEQYVLQPAFISLYTDTEDSYMISSLNFIYPKMGRVFVWPLILYRDLER